MAEKTIYLSGVPSAIEKLFWNKTCEACDIHHEPVP